MKRVIPILALFILVGVAFAWWSTSRSPGENSQQPALQSTLLSPASVTHSAQPQPLQSGTLQKSPPAGVSAPLIQFLQDESKAMNSTQIDVSQAEEKTRAQAAKLSEADIRYLRDLALGSDGPANQRVLAAYLLSKGGALSWTAMEDLLLAPSASGRAEPHSVDELRNVQSKSIALMQVDGLAEQAVKDSNARERLIRWGSLAKDTTVQKYIQQRIRELPPL